MANQLIGALDFDGDGALSMDKLKTALSSTGSTTDFSQSIFERDADSDGSISAEELTPAVEANKPSGPPPGGPPPELASGDADDIANSISSAFITDGEEGLSLSEVSAALRIGEASEETSDTFDALDSNQDGVVSSAELAAGLKAQFAEAIRRAASAYL